MWLAFPASDYYGPSAPSRRQQPTADLPATALDERRGGQRRDGSHVQRVPVDGVRRPAFPLQPRHGYAAGFLRGPRPANSTGFRGRPPSLLRKACTAAQPISTRFELVLSLRGFHHWFVRTYAFPVSLAGPGSSGSADPSRRRQGCSHPSLRFQGRTALSFGVLLRQAAGGSFQPTRITRHFMAARTAGNMGTHRSFRQSRRSTGAETIGRSRRVVSQAHPTHRPALNSRPWRGGTFARRTCARV